MIIVPEVNGVIMDPSSVEFSAGALKLTRGLFELNYMDSLEPGEVKGFRTDPMGATRGTTKRSASFTLVELMAEELMTNLGNGYGTKFVNYKIVKTHTKGSYIDTFVARITKVEQVSMTQGNATALAKKFELWLLDMTLNGRRISDQTLTESGQ